MENRKSIWKILFFVWMLFILAAFYVVQKPVFFQYIDAFTQTVASFGLFILLIVNSFSIGILFLSWIQDSHIRLLLGSILGLGFLGILGFLFASVGATHPFFILGVQGLFFSALLIKKKLPIAEFIKFFRMLAKATKEAPKGVLFSILIMTGFSFLLTFTPPVDSFDALLYHLTVPALWIRDGGLRAYNMPPYWFPSLVEGAYFWGVACKNDIVPQMLHFSWASLSLLITWFWTRQIANEKLAWWSVALVFSMPSFPWVASWAYTDFALASFSLGVFYSLWYGKVIKDDRFLYLGAVFAGLAMGVKYTSFIVPIGAGLLLFIWGKDNYSRLFKQLIHFSLVSVAVGGIWYLRNWILMGNPVYPFVFGGHYWDIFRANWYAEVGTGIGWSLKEWALLPLSITLGVRDATFFDGRIGPLFLFFLPFIPIVYKQFSTEDKAKKSALTAIGIFSGLSFIFWAFGVSSTQALWQARLLFPALILLSTPLSLGIAIIEKHDNKALKLSFIVKTVITIVLFVNLIDLGMNVIRRNPLSLILGIETKQSYIENRQPAYAATIKLVNTTPENAYIYFLFEPRSYWMPRKVFPDTLLDNLPHDIFSYENAAEIIHFWQEQGYSHVLLSRRGADFIITNKALSLDRMEAILAELEEELIFFGETENSAYILYEIPKSEN